jgi:hypothetical protein
MYHAFFVFFSSCNTSRRFPLFSRVFSYFYRSSTSIHVPFGSMFRPTNVRGKGLELLRQQQLSVPRLPVIEIEDAAIGSLVVANLLAPLHAWPSMPMDEGLKLKVSFYFFFICASLGQ